MSRTRVQWKGLRQRNRSLNCSVSCSPESSWLVWHSWWWYEGWTNHSACLKGPGGHWCCWCHMQVRQCCCWIWALIPRDRAITNLLKYLTTNQSMRHTECHLQHALYTSRRLTVNQNVEKLLNFVQARQNPYSLAADIPVPLHNIFTKLAVDREVAARLLKCIENGDRVYSAYRQERFVNKTTKISSNISKRNLPEFAHHPQKTPH